MAVTYGMILVLVLYSHVPKEVPAPQQVSYYGTKGLYHTISAGGVSELFGTHDLYRYLQEDIDVSVASG